MNSVLYWKECINDLSQLEEYSETINALLCGEYSSLRLEQLHIQSISPIYSIRHSDSTRLLFTTFQGKICILEVILNHDYAKSRFLRNRYCLKNHLQKISDAITSSVVEQPILPISSTPSTHLQPSPVIFHQQFIELNAHQNEVIQAAFPMVLHGPAGSGKTTVAIELLKKLHQSASTPIIYVTESQKLKDYVQDIWQNLHQDEIFLVRFLTYQEFLIQVLHIPAEKILTREHFHLWFKQNKKAREFPKDELFKEFRIISGYSSLEKYQSLGARQSHFTENRVKIYNLFQSYMQSLGGDYAKELSSSETSSPDTHLVVDEAQDFSFGQLKTLMNFASGRCAILLGDHQILFDGLSRFPYIKQYYYEHFSHAIQTYALSDNYRCSEKISHFANLVTEFKYHQTGGALDKIEVPSMNANLAEFGSTEWLKATPEQFQDIQQRDFSNPYAIINFSHESHESFIHPLVFSPIECKGLEFDTVILWKPFESNSAIIFSDHKMESSKETLSAHRAKSGKSNLEHLNAFNALITSITRAKKRLMIIDSYPLERSTFLQSLYQNCSPVESLEEEKDIEMNEKMWLEQAKILFKQGFELQASKILIHKLQYTEEVIEVFKQELLASSQVISSSSTPSPATITERLSPTEEIVHSKPFKKKAAIQSIPILDNFYGASDYKKAFQDLFSSQSNYSLETLLTFKYPHQSILDCIAQNEDYWHAFIFMLGSHSDMLTKIAPICEKLKKLHAEKNLKELFNLIDKNKKSCTKKMNYTLLHIACVAKNSTFLNLCLMLQVDINLLNEHCTAAHILCDTPNFNMDCWPSLLQNKPDLNIRDALGYTPLHYLAEHGYIEALHYLFIQKIPIDFSLKNKNNDTALDISIERGHFDCFKILIENGANPFDSSTTLSAIIENQSLEFLNFILEFEGLQENLHKMKNVMLTIAIEKEKYDALELLINQMNFNECSTFLENLKPLHYAVNNKKIKLIQYLLQKNLDINGLDADDSTSLHVACRLDCKNKKQIITLLLTNGAKIDIPDKNGQYPINALMKRGECDLIELFITHGLNVHHCYDENNLAHLITLCDYEKQKKLISLLEKYKVDLNQKNMDGHTPLMLAVHLNNHPEIIEKLYNEEVDLHFTPDTKFQFLNSLITHYKLDVLKKFVSRGLTIDTNMSPNLSNLSILNIILDHLMLTTDKAPWIEKATYLIENGADLISKSFDCTPICRSIKMKIPHITQLLLKHRAYQLDDETCVLEEILKTDFNVDTFDEHGNAAIHYACLQGNINSLMLLIKHKANINLPNAKGQTPFILACISKQIGLIGTLLKENANINGVDNKGNSAIFYLTIAGYSSIIKKLAENNQWNLEVLNTPNQQGYTALLSASLQNNFSLVKILLELGANPFIMTPTEYNPLHQACKIPEADIRIIQLLIQSGLSLDEANIHGITPLMLLIRYNPMIARDFISSNTSDMHLHFACQHGEIEVVRQLLSQIANWNTANAQWISSLMIAFLHKKWDIFRELCFHGAKYQLSNGESSSLSMG